MNRTATSEAIMIDLRRRRMQQLVGAIMEEVGRTIPSDFQGDLHDALAKVFHDNGAYIMTDQDRAEFGLEPRDYLGWTPSERVKAEADRRNIMLQMMNVSIALKESSQDG
jgi:hypothetical protein